MRFLIAESYPLKTQLPGSFICTRLGDSSPCIFIAVIVSLYGIQDRLFVPNLAEHIICADSLILPFVF